MSYIKNEFIYKAESSSGAGEPDFGVNDERWLFLGDSGKKGGLLYPNPAANLVGAKREEWLFE